MSPIRQIPNRITGANNKMTIFEEISLEREYQDQRWGELFDDKNTVNDWGSFVSLYLGRAVSMGATPAEQRKGMLKAASLCVAALETFDRNNGFASRHYDKGYADGKAA